MNAFTELFLATHAMAYNDNPIAATVEAYGTIQVSCDGVTWDDDRAIIETHGHPNATVCE